MLPRAWLQFQADILLTGPDEACHEVAGEQPPSGTNLPSVCLSQAGRVLFLLLEEGGGPD